MKSRITVVFLVLVLLGFVVLVGLHQRNTSSKSEILNPERWLRTPGSGRQASVSGRRGTILDRNGAVLAKDSTRPETGGTLERVYPLGETAANLIGFTSSPTHDPRTPTPVHGTAGLELGVDSALSSHWDQPVCVTIDADMQRAAFQILQRYVSSTRAARASAVAMSGATGEILALADYPGYDPTKARMYPEEVWRCHVVTDQFAPGPLVDDWVARSEGGTQVADALGFGHSTGIGLPDETAGELADSLSATRTSLLQLVQAYSVIANEGRVNRPSLVAAQATGDRQRTIGREQIIERTFAAQCLASLPRDTEGGTEFLGAGGNAGPDSLSPLLVFVGVFPAPTPEYVVGVMLDRPLAGYYTPETARLLFKDIARCVSGQ